MTSRRQFLGAAAALAALPTDRAAEAAQDGADGTPADAPADEPTDATDGADDPLAGLCSSLYAEGVLDERAALDPRASKLWDGEEWVPVVDLYVRVGQGAICVTLDEEAGLALAEQLHAAFADDEE